MRSGVIAQKVGMTRVFTDAGEHIPVTVLKALAPTLSPLVARQIADDTAGVTQSPPPP